MLDVCSKLQRSPRASVAVQELVHTGAHEVDHSLLEGELLVAQMHGLPQRGVVVFLAPVLEVRAAKGLPDDFLSAQNL